MANKRRSLEERILAREEKIKAEKAELQRLVAMQEMAGPRSEWVDEMYTVHGIEAQPKDIDERQRLSLLRESMAASAGETEALQEAQAKSQRLEEELADAQLLKGRLFAAVLKMAGELGIQAESEKSVWSQVKQRYGLA